MAAAIGTPERGRSSRASFWGDGLLLSGAKQKHLRRPPPSPNTRAHIPAFPGANAEDESSSEGLRFAFFPSCCSDGLQLHLTRYSRSIVSPSPPPPVRSEALRPAPTASRDGIRFGFTWGQLSSFFLYPSFHWRCFPYPSFYFKGSFQGKTIH